MTGESHERITFFFRPGTHILEAWLVGDFNGWDTSADPMAPQSDGSFLIEKALPAGRYEYKFFADGIYFSDGDAESQVVNPYGTVNSVVDVTAR